MNDILGVILIAFFLTMWISVCNVDRNTDETNHKLDKIIELMEKNK